MKALTIDTENNITVYASRKAARETGLGVFASEEQLAELIGADNKPWSNLEQLPRREGGQTSKLAAERCLEDDSTAEEETRRG